MEQAGCLTLKTNLHGQPDIFASCPFGDHGEGIAVLIEVKRPGEKPEPIQIATMDRWRKAGAIVFWADRAGATVDRIMNELQQRKVGEFLPTT